MDLFSLESDVFKALLTDPEFQQELEGQPPGYTYVWRLFVNSVVKIFSDQELDMLLDQDSFVQMRMKILRHRLSHDWIEQFYQCIASSFTSPITLRTAVQTEKRGIRELIDVLEQMLDDVDDLIYGCSVTDFLLHDSPEAGHLSEATIDRLVGDECFTIGGLLVTQPFALLRSVDS